MTISSYLTFSGNCREAFEFYKNCLGGELTFQTIGETPLAAKMPKQMKESILHARLVNKSMILLGSDMVGEEGLIKGNSVSLMLECDSEEEIKSCYEKLSAGGKSTHPIETSFFGALLGDLKDKYGNNWILHFHKT